MDADGSNMRQVTHLGGANFAPYWHPDGKRILFSSNHEDPTDGSSKSIVIGVDGTGLTRITHSERSTDFPYSARTGATWRSVRTGTTRTRTTRMSSLRNGSRNDRRKGAGACAQLMHTAMRPAI